SLRCGNDFLEGEKLLSQRSVHRDRIAAESPILLGGRMKRLIPHLVSSLGFALVPFAVHALDIKGAVTGPNGPEAGVWVIAETTDLPTKFAKVVVTDDQGRYLIPQLPKATYKVWARGYGLADSAKVTSAPGKTVNIKTAAARSEKEAAEL